MTAEKTNLKKNDFDVLNLFCKQGLIFACGATASAFAVSHYYCGKIEDVVAEQKASKQDLLNMLAGVHSKDDMFNITSKLLYSEVQKTETLLKEVDTPDLLRLSRLQKSALRDVQEVIKVRSDKNQDEIAIKKAEVKFHETFSKLQTYVKEQTLRSLGMHEGELIQKQGKMNNAPVLIPQAVNTR